MTLKGEATGCDDLWRDVTLVDPDHSVGACLGNSAGNVTSLSDILATHNLFVSTAGVTEANFITIILSCSQS